MDNSNKKLIELIRYKFQRELLSKTGWGRNEIMKAFERAVLEAVMELN